MIDNRSMQEISNMKKEILDLIEGLGVGFTKVQEETDKLTEKIRNLAVDGLTTDGGHHKQWYLEEILKAIGVDLKELRHNLNAAGYDWDEGVAP